MKKCIAGTISAVLLLTLAACGPGAPSQSAPASVPPSPSPSAEQSAAPSPSAAPKQNVTITYMASQDWVTDAEMQLGQKFTAETGIKVDYQIVPADQYSNLLMTKLNTGDCTDLFGSQGGKFDIVSQLNVEKNAVNLSGEEWASRLDPLAAEQVSANGKVYGQPAQDISAVWAVAYNKKIFSSLNLSVPKTFNEFMAVCEAIKKSGVTPIYECVADGWHHVLWFPELGAAIEKNEPGTADKLNNNQTTFAQSPTSKLIIDQIKQMVDKGYWGTSYMDNTYDKAPANFASGKYAMFVGNEGFPGEVHTADPNFSADDIGFFVMPLADNQIMNVNPVVPTRFIYSGSPNIDAAKKYLAYIAKPENLQYQIDNVAKFMALPISGGTPKYAGTIKAFYDAYPNHGTVYQTAVKYVNPQWMDIGKGIANVILGQEDSIKMLQDVDKSRASQAATAKDPAWQK